MTLFLLVISLVANAMVMANNCDNGKSFVTDFDPAKFQKVWYSVYEPLALSPTFNHFSNDFGSNGVVSSEAKSLGKTVKFTGEYTAIQKDGSFNYTSEARPVFSGKYKVPDTDYECYAILNGCPTSGPYEKLTWVAFTKKNPERACERKALKELIKLNIPITQFSRTVYA